MKIIPIKTAKGRDGILVNKFRYRKDKALVTGEISWRCTNRNCSAMLRTNSTVTLLKSRPSTHNHDPPDSDVPSTPSASEPSTPTSLTPSLFSIDTNTTTTPVMSPIESNVSSLTDLLAPGIALTPASQQLMQIDQENLYLRRRVAELEHTNEVLQKQITQLTRSQQGQELSTPTLTPQMDKCILKHNCSTEKLNISHVNVAESQIQTSLSPENKLSASTSTQTETFVFSNLDGIHVVEADMGDVIDELKTDSSTAFAHCISGDFHHRRQMTAGVAVTFKKRFGKPQLGDCLTKFLAYQKTTDGSAVYSLITKPNYDGKPTEEDYDAAFDELIEDFKEKGFRTLICSPMGCVRDLIELEHFAVKINQFHQITGATVIIVTKNQKAGRILRHGLSHSEFVKQLRSKIKNCQNSTNWYLLPDEDIKLYLERVDVPKNTLVLEPVVGHLIKSTENTEHLAKLLEDLAVKTYDYILAPVNNRKDDSREGGGHWSLLMYARDSSTYYHLDSLEPLNGKHAERLAAHLSGDPCVSVVQLRCRRQLQSVECGAYVLHFIEVIASRIRDKKSVQDDRCYAQKFSINSVYENIIKYKKSSQPKEKSMKRKVTLLSDSHGLGLRHLLQERLGAESVVSSVVKPSATLENVTSDVDSEALRLGSNDHLIILGGCNNISLNTKFDIKSSVKEVANKTKNTNVILCTVPLRYDRPDLNRQIRKINIELVIEALKYEHIKVVSLSNLFKESYTRHGLHFNHWGKQKLTNLIEEKINCVNLN